MRRTIPWIAGIAIAALPGGIAAAQGSSPRFVASEPSPGAFVHQAPDDVSITFSEPLGAGSTMGVTDECGRRVDAGNVTLEENQMSVSLTAGPSGTYTVTYSAMGTEDSQTTPGSFTFRAHLGPSCDGSDGDEGDHGGHGGHNDDGGDMKDHQGHPEGGSRTDHDAHNVAQTHTSSHSMTDHEETEHADGDHSQSESERKRSGHPHRGRDTEPPTQEGGNSPTGATAGAAASAPAAAGGPEATGSDLVIALGLAIGLGALGGVLLRFNPLD
jgi:methionine-rich copper-binding protein CopC